MSTRPTRKIPDAHGDQQLEKADGCIRRDLLHPTNKKKTWEVFDIWFKLENYMRTHDY